MKKSFHGRIPGILNFGVTTEFCRENSNQVAQIPKIDIAGSRKGDQKIFCIGFPKTGTTSLESALCQLGASFGNQAVGEILAQDWANGETKRIVGFCHTADAFQDLPFSMPKLFQCLDKEFPGSKFILTIRDSAEVWFESLVRFHISKFSTNSNVPSEEMLREANYRYRGFVLDTRKMFWGYPEVDLYDRDHYMGMYDHHVESILKFFDGRDEDLLVLNVSDRDSFQSLGKFFGLEIPSSIKFPWLNRTS